MKAQHVTTSDTIELVDQSEQDRSAEFLSKNVSSRFPEAITAKLCRQFIDINRPNLSKVGVEVRTKYDGSKVSLTFTSNLKIGAIPLLSPITSKYSISLLIKPRFGWNGIGSILQKTGWKEIPQILHLPQLTISERRIPQWVLSSVILHRLDRLLRQLGRRFEMTTRQLSVPKGQVNWNSYATKSLPKANYLNFECRFPTLQDNSKIKSFIKFTLQTQRNSLETQRDQGVYVLQLIDFCKKLESKLGGTVPQKPNTNELILGSDSISQANDFYKGIEAIIWSAENAGLAGVGDLNGLPWSLSMEKLFESYTESVFQKIVRQFGGLIKSGRKHETLIPIQWEQPFLGSQNSLIPDIIIEKEDQEIIIDAKYKNHWEELNINRWYNLDEHIKKHHRNDILQLLAYSSVSNKSKISCCLIYPCKRDTFEKLKRSRRIFNTAQISHNQRSISFHLTAIPFNISDDELDYLSPLFKNSDML